MTASYLTRAKSILIKVKLGRKSLNLIVRPKILTFIVNELPMKKSLTTLLFLAILQLSANAQSKSYFTLCAKGDSLFHAGEFLQSAQSYEAAFATFRQRALVNDRYHAA